MAKLTVRSPEVGSPERTCVHSTTETQLLKYERVGRLHARAKSGIRHTPTVLNEVVKLTLLISSHS